jgi:hypothetical protein
LLLSALCAGGLSLLASGQARAMIASPQGARVEGQFESQSGAVRLSTSSALPWTTPGVGPYAPLVPRLGAPPLLPPAPPSYPAFTGFVAGTDFQTTTFPILFNDLGGTTGTVAGARLGHTFSPTPTNIEDFRVTIPNWRVNQQPLASGYVVNQLNFVSSYAFSAFSPGTLLKAAPLMPVTVRGRLATASSYAQFDAIFNYTFTPFVGTGSLLGTPVLIGDITYSTTITGSVTPFTITDFGVNNLPALGFPIPALGGILEVQGYAYIAGDPFEMEVTTLVPEPAAAVLLGGLLLTLRRLR